ncbi:unnamed protein product [Rodentolepis nana]|uniref:Kinesin motor domain-containing protein n=1 Tax=Rodentolepis nana TaxID=102285 RepID=A0A0R3T9W3_RODNA|nr:unnamed protein product [Rodentolepis nana]
MGTWVECILPICEDRQCILPIFEGVLPGNPSVRSLNSATASILGQSLNSTTASILGQSGSKSATVHCFSFLRGKTQQRLRFLASLQWLRFLASRSKLSNGFDSWPSSLNSATASILGNRVTVRSLNSATASILGQLRSLNSATDSILGHGSLNSATASILGNRVRYVV